jgi:hypothetical protein
MDLDTTPKPNREKEYERRRDKIPCPHCNNIYNRNSHNNHRKVCPKNKKKYLNLTPP